ncbi:MAG: hypothetical protein IT350_16620 [Deltaproteobacteria bacterium]|nr:hypothetical protein [Deltaproteobacteria bacterium]
MTEARADRTPASGPPMWAVLVIVAAIVAAAALFASWWNAATQPVFAARAHPVLHRALLHENSAAPYELSSMVPDNRPPVLELARVMTSRFGRSYRAIMAAQTTWLALWIMLAAALGFVLAGRGAAIVASALAAATPMAWVCALGFDDHLFNLVLTMAAVLALALSDRLTRPVAALAAGALAGLAIRYAFIASNGILTAGAVLCAAGGLVAEDLAARRRHLAASLRGGVGRIPRELRPQLVGTAFLLVGLVAGLWRADLASQAAFGYYAGEVGNSPARGALDWLIALPIYLDISARHLLGPAMFIATVVGLVALVRSAAPGRGLLVAWFAVPVVALSVFPKKNPYYIYAALAAAPVIVAAVLARVRPDARRRVVTAVVIAACSAWTAWHATRGGDAEMPKLFAAYTFEQGAYVLRAPVTKPSLERAEADAIHSAARARRAPGDALLFIVPGAVGPMEELRYFLQEHDAAARVFAIALAEITPPTDVSPFLLVPRGAWDAAGERGAAGVIDDSVAYVLRKVEKTHDAMGQIETAGDPVARAEYLRALAGAAWAVVYESDRYVLLDGGVS